MIKAAAGGLVAAAEVKGDVRQEGNDEQYRDVTFLTPCPNRHETLKAMTAADFTKATGRNFFWARTIKVRHLNREEADRLVEELNKVLS